MKLSVIVSAFNAEKKIENCLKSVEFADEIIVLDNSSTDKTGEIAKKYGTVIKQKNDPSAIDLLRNTGIRAAKGDWILIVDQDEEITEELREEILGVIKHHPSTSLRKEGLESKDENIEGYWIPRKNLIFGKWMEHTGWWPDLQLRLFKRGSGEYEEKHVHQFVNLKGKTEELTNSIKHFHYESITEFLTKTILVYAPNEAEYKIREGYKFSYFDAIRFPVNEFLSRYFAREGYKDGFHGLMLSLLMSFYHFAVFAYIWERNKFPQTSDINIEKELAKTGKEVKYWIKNSKIKDEKNPIKRLFYKAK